MQIMSDVICGIVDSWCGGGASMRAASSANIIAV